MSIKVTNYLCNLKNEITDTRWDLQGEYELPFVSDESRRFRVKESKNFVTNVKDPSSRLSVWVKRFMESNSLEVDKKIVNEVLFSRIYNELGVNAIVTYPCFFIEPNIQNRFSQSCAKGVVSQDIKAIEQLDTRPLSDKWYPYMYQRKLENMLKDKSRLVEREFEVNLNAELLINNNIVANVLDLIMLLQDNHFSNKFAIGKKYNGHEDVVSFDFEDNNLNYKYFYDNIDGFENYPIRSKIIIAREKDETLRGRLGYIKNLYKEGRLPDGCHSMFRRLANLNIDKLIKDAESETGYPILKSEQTDRIRSLVDYNQEFMAK